MDIKQVIVIRKDLNMRKGKIIAQGSHASMGCILNFGKIDNNRIILELDALTLEWIEGLQKKISVYVESEKELLDIYNKAKENNINVKLITDYGLTEFKGLRTLTCLALGPDNAEKLDIITGHLKLL